MCYSLSDIYLPIFLVTTSYLSFVRYLDGIKTLRLLVRAAHPFLCTSDEYK